jgi:hypothetical protein
MFSIDSIDFINNPLSFGFNNTKITCQKSLVLLRSVRFLNV